MKPAKGWRRALHWLAPGLLVKRWFFITTMGAVFTVIGFSIWVNLKPIHTIYNVIEYLAQILPNQISGPIVFFGGLFLFFWGQLRSLGAVTDALQPDGGREDLLNKLLHQRRLNKGPKIVTIGGGTGLSTLLRGLKYYSSNITAIVTVADDGGSSGRLRKDFGMLPPGDIRNCLAALADEEKLLTELFQYRFTAGDGLEGHSFGNLFLTAMSEITGDLERATAACSKVLAIRGRVLPATLADVELWAEMSDGCIVRGESTITETGGQILSIGCTPNNPPALPAAIEAIENADYIVIGPGSLYTSVIPNLLVPEICHAIANRRCPSIYVCNIMTQPGETTGYSVSDHIKAIDRACKQQLFDAVLVQKNSPSPGSLARYSREKAHPVFTDREEIRKLKRQIFAVNVMDEDLTTSYVRHNSRRLARALMYWHQRSRALEKLEDVPTQEIAHTA
jgi:uncharacterized cofD-like protein